MKKAAFVISTILLGIIIAGGAFFIIFRDRLLDNTYYTDADSIKVGIDDAPVRDILWQPAVPLDDGFATEGDEYEPRITADGTTLYFVRGTAGSNADILRSVRVLDGWSEPEPFDVINTEFDELGATPSPDGRTVYFYSNRPGGLGGYDIWKTTRDNNGWSEPINLGQPVNTPFNDYGPAPSADGNQLYFSSNRPPPIPPQIDKTANDKQVDLNDGEAQANSSPQPFELNEDQLPMDQAKSDYDLYLATRADGQFANVTPITELNTNADEVSPALTPRGDFMYFASNRDGGEGAFDLYRARILPDRPLVAQNLGDAINTPADELDPSLDLAGFILHFSSDREIVPQDSPPLVADPPKSEQSAGPQSSTDVDNQHTTDGLDDTNIDQAESQPTITRGDYDLYQSTSREVFRETDRASIDWREIWAILLPLLLWLLLGLFIFFILAKLYQNTKFNALSLLAKCLLTSLLIHLLILLGLTVWTVSSSFSEYMRQDSGRKVVLTSPSMAESIATQVRGRLTEMEVEVEEPSPASQQLTNPTQQQVTQTAVQMPVVEQVTRPVDTQMIVSQSVQEALVQQPQIEPTELTEPTEFEQLPSESIATLDQPTPITTSEQALATQAPIADAPPQSPTVARDQPTQTTAEFVPQQTNPAEMLAPTESLVEAPAESEAATVSPPVTSTDIARDPTEAPTEAIDLATALPSSEPAEQMSEPTAQVESTLGAESQAIKSGNTEPGITVDVSRTVEVSPSSVEFETEDASLASDSPVVRDAEASEQPVELAQATTDSIDLEPATENTDLSVPTATAQETTSEDGVAIQVAADAAADDAAPMRDDLAIPTDAPPAVTAMIDPDSSSSSSDEREEETLAETSTDSVLTDAQPLDSPLDATWTEAFDAIPSEQVAAELAGPLESLPAESVSEASDVEADAAIATADTTRTDDIADALPSESVDTSLIDLVPDAIADAATDAQSSLYEAPAESTASEFDAVPTLNINTGPDLVPAEMAVAAADMPSVEAMGDAMRIPTEIERRPNPLAHREPERRAELLEAMGGSRETERAVALALDWLARHQSANGRWDADDFDHHCEQCGGESPANIDVALTGLSLLAFLGADHTHDKPGPYRDNVNRALDYLLKSQHGDDHLPGYFGDETLYSHGIATIAICEAYTMTGDQKLGDAARRAVQFILASPSERTGGWRYAPGQDGDTSVTGWQVMALAAAKRADIQFPESELQHVQVWMDSVRHPDELGRYAYQPGRQYTDAMTAEGMFIQELMGVDREDADMLASAEYLTANKPDWDKDPNTYYWYYGTLAMFHHGGPQWTTWNDALKNELVANQRTSGRARGSWDTDDPWSTTGSRVYQTAICALSLEVYYRYLPMYSGDQDIEPAGTIRGTVYEKVSKQPLMDATVLLDIPGGNPMMVTTNSDGDYSIRAPRMPAFFALSASKPGYEPESVTASASELHGKVLVRDFSLERVRNNVIAIEDRPTVHHLGNDRHEGVINSQFQKKSEGRTFKARFNVDREQLPPIFDQAEIRLLVKGVQARNKIRINGRLLKTRLDRAPDDGRYGEFQIPFNIRMLQVGENEISIQSTDDLGDLDDFEFINIRIHLFRNED